LNFTCSLTQVDDIVTVSLYGDIDLSATAQVRETLQSAARDDAVQHIVVDLAGVTFIDSTALGVLVATHTAAQRRGATFVVTNPGSMATMVLTVTGLFDLLVDRGHQSDDAAPLTASGG
jgi:anti-sigma B factor antagonist